MTNENKHFTEADRIFFSDGYQLAQSAILKGFSVDTLFTGIKLLYAAIDLLNDSIISLAKRQSPAVVCFNGCHWCCHQAVFANTYELKFLAKKIKKISNSEELGAIIEKAKAKHAITSNLNVVEILKYKAPCPLLKNSSCSIYAARPMACRIYLSTKLKSCIDFYHHPENETEYPALIDFPLKAGRMMNEGFCTALKEIGLEIIEFKLEEGLLIELENNLYTI
jgi:Fe-S-cluster containining protein